METSFEIKTKKKSIGYTRVQTERLTRRRTITETKRSQPEQSFEKGYMIGHEGKEGKETKPDNKRVNGRHGRNKADTASNSHFRKYSKPLTGNILGKL